jgi:type IV pilus assembly protein PilA
MAPLTTSRIRDERGFTLIELLVVILIIGILAAIAIPAFLNQKNKANDAAAKTQARTAETAAETYATDHNGEYGGMSPAALKTIEPTLNETSSVVLIEATASGGGYSVASESVATKDKFKITRNNGVITRECALGNVSNKGGCPNSSATTYASTATW